MDGFQDGGASGGGCLQTPGGKAECVQMAPAWLVFYRRAPLCFLFLAHDLKVNLLHLFAAFGKSSGLWLKSFRGIDHRNFEQSQRFSGAGRWLLPYL